MSLKCCATPVRTRTCYNTCADPDRTGYAYDFALVKLERKIRWDEYPHIRPVCLPADASQTYEGQNATVAGWGITYLEFPVLKLQEVEVGVISNKV